MGKGHKTTALQQLMLAALSILLLTIPGVGWGQCSCSGSKWINNAGVTGDWDNPSTWAGNSCSPSSSNNTESICISGNVVLNNTAAAFLSNWGGSITVCGSLEVKGDMTVYQNFTVNGTLKVDGNLNVQGATFTNATVIVGGNLVKDGDVKFTGNGSTTLTVGGNLTTNSATEIVGYKIDVKGDMDAKASLKVDGAINVDGKLSVNGATFAGANVTVGKDFVANNGGSVNFNGSGTSTLSVGGGFTSNTSTVISGYNIAVGGDLVANSNEIKFNGDGSSTMTIGGSLTSNTSTLISGYTVGITKDLVSSSNPVNIGTGASASKVAVHGNLSTSSTPINVGANGEFLVHGNWDVKSGSNSNIAGTMAVKGSLHADMGVDITNTGNLLIFGGANITGGSANIKGDLLVAGKLDTPPDYESGTGGNIYSFDPTSKMGQNGAKIGIDELKKNEGLYNQYTQYQEAFGLAPLSVALKATVTSPVCAGTEVTFTAKSTRATSYDFYINGAATPAQSGASSTYTYIPANGDKVSVVASDGTTTASATSEAYTVNEQPSITGYTFKSPAVCTGYNGVAEMSASEKDVSYQLYSGGVAFGSPVPGTGSPLSFSIDAPSQTASYSVTATAPSGCTASLPDAFTLTVNTPPSFEDKSTSAIYPFTAPAVCAGSNGTVVMGGSEAGISYQLNNGTTEVGDPSVGTGSSVSFTIPKPTATMWYNIVATNPATGCTASLPSAFEFEVNAMPDAQIAASKTTLCAGDAITITATDGGTSDGTYTFYRNGQPIAGTTGNAITLSDLATNDEVYAVVKNTSGCSMQSATLTFTVNPRPSSVLLISDPDNKICFGDNIILTASSGMADYNFIVNGVVGLSQGVNSNTYATTTLPVGKIPLAVTVTNSYGCTYTTPAVEVEVLAAPNAASLTKDIVTSAICYGTPVTFTGPSGGNTYNFSVNGAYRGDQSVSNLTISDLPVGKAEVKVRVSNSLGCTAESNAITMDVNALPTPSISPISPATICAGTPVTFTALPASGVTYAFTIDGNPATPAPVGNTLTTSALVNGSEVGVTVTDGNGCSATSTAKPITVNPLPSAAITSSDADNIVCQGANVTFSAPNGGSNYIFTIGEHAYDNGASNTITRNDLVNGQTISVKVTSLEGCVASTALPLTITVQPPPGTPGKIIGSTKPSGLFPKTITYGSSGLAGVDTYNWKVLEPGFGSTGPNNNNKFDVTWAEGGVFTVRVYSHNVGCGDGPFQEVKVHSTVAISPADTPTTNTTNFCIGSPVIFTSNSSGSLGAALLKGYRWQVTQPDGTVVSELITSASNNHFNFTPTQRGLHHIKVCHYLWFLDYFDGQYSNEMNFSVDGEPVNPTLTADLGTSICKGTAVKFSGSPSATGYNFKVNGISKLSGPASTFTTSDLNSGDVVMVEVSNSCGVSTSPSLTMAVKTIQPVTLAAVPNPICSNGTAVFTATPAGAVSYDFFVGGVKRNSSAANNYTSASGVVVNGSKAKVVMTDVCGNSTSPEITMGVLPPPSGVSLGVAPGSTVCAGTPAVFTATAGYTSYQFKVNDVNVGTAGPSNTFTLDTPAPGDKISVEVTDPCGLTATSASSITMTVNPIPTKTLTLNPATAIICAGSTLHVTAPAGWPSYSYRVNGVEVESSSSNEHSFTGLNNGDKVSVGITYSCGGSSLVMLSNDYPVTVNPMPTAVLSALPASSTICAGTPVAFTASGGDTYQFTLNGGSIKDATAATYSTSALRSGDIVGVVATSNGCSSAATLPAYTVNPQPIPTLTGTPVCAGTNIDLSLKEPYSSYSWTVVADPSVTPPLTFLETPAQKATVVVPDNDTLFPVGSSAKLINATISVTVTDAKGCSNATPSSVVVPIHRIPRTGPPYHISNSAAK